MKTLLAFLALSLTTAHAAPPDIIVYSGVPCGIAASITAARDGAKDASQARATNARGSMNDRNRHIPRGAVFEFP